MGLQVTSGQYDVVLLTPRDFGGVVGLATVLKQQPQSQMPLQAYAMGPPQVGFSFRFECPTIFICVAVCSCVCFVLSGAMQVAIFTFGDSAVEVCTIEARWSLPMADVCNLVMVISPHQECTEWLLPPLL